MPSPTTLEMSGKRVGIVAHILKYAEADDLLRFLIESGTGETIFIGHPLEFVAGRPGPRRRLFRGEQLVADTTLRNRHWPSFLLYGRDLVLTLYWMVTTRRRWDLIVACDNLNALAALILRRLGLARRVVYWTIDFVPQRFANRRLNEVYHFLDRLCLEHADVTWNVSAGIAKGRETVRGLAVSKYNRQLTVPIGGWFTRLPRREFSAIESHSVVYSGGLLPHHNLELILDSVPEIIGAVPDFRLYITGLGPLENDLKRRAHDLAIETHVHFLGYLESHEELHELLSRCAAGLAMYSAEMDVWSRYADPAKIKLYLSAGLPIFTTNVTHMAPELSRRRAGRIVAEDAHSLAEVVIKLLTDSKELREYRARALEFGSEFDWPAIFTTALSDPRLGLAVSTLPDR